MGCLINLLNLIFFISFYRPVPEVQQYLVNNQVAMKGRDVPNPILQFDECGIPDALMACIRRNAFEKPTVIQSVGWPIALSGRDMVGIAQTGSGKTLAVSCIINNCLIFKVSKVILTFFLTFNAVHTPSNHSYQSPTTSGTE